jgi:hypothetical protein
VDKLRVYLIKANTTFEGTTAEASEQIGDQMNTDLMNLSQGRNMRQMITR